MVLLPLFSVGNGDGNFSENGKVGDMIVDGSSPKKIFVRNSFHLTPSDILDDRVRAVYTQVYKKCLI